MNTKSTQFAVGDTVRLKRKIGAVPAGTAGVVIRVDDDGGLWVKINADEGRSERCVMTVDYLDNLEKIKETDGKNEEAVKALIAHRIRFADDFGWDKTTLEALDIAIASLTTESKPVVRGKWKRIDEYVYGEK